MQFEMPKPSEAHVKLSALAGSWRGEEKMHPSPWDPKGSTAKARIESRMDVDGFFLLTDYVQEKNGAASFRGHGVIGWDAPSETYKFFWFDSMGMIPKDPATGRFEGKRLTFEQSCPEKGMSNRYVYDVEPDGTYRFAVLMSQDGKTWSPMMEGHYRRAK